MKKLITNIDYFSLEPKVYVECKENKKTSLGGILSIMSFILTIMGSYYFGQEVWVKKSPVVNQAVESLQEPPTLKLDKENWDIMFALQYNNNFFNDPRVYSVEANTFHVQKNNTVLLKKINLENCLKSSFSELLFPYFKGYSYENLICISKKQEGYINNTLTIQKQFGQVDFKLLIFLFKPCINSTISNIVCESPEEIEKRIGSTYFSIFTIDNFTKTKNLTHPFIKYTYNNFLTVGMKSFSTVSLYMLHKTITSDLGFLFTEEKVIKSYGINEFKVNFTPKSAEDGTFLRLEVQLKSLQDNIFRKYIKLQELMAQIGGIYNLVNIISRTLIYFYNHFYYKVFLVDKFFNYYEGNNYIQITYPLLKRTSVVKEINSSKKESNKKIKHVTYKTSLKNPGELSSATRLKRNLQSQPNDLTDNANALKQKSNKENNNQNENSNIELNQNNDNKSNNDNNNLEKSINGIIIENDNKTNLPTQTESKIMISIKNCKDRELLNLKPLKFSTLEIMRSMCKKSKKKIFVDNCFEIIKNHLSVENLVNSDRTAKLINHFTLSEEAKALIQNVEKYSNSISFSDLSCQNFKKQDKDLIDMYRSINSDEYVRKKEKKQLVFNLNSKSQNKLNLVEDLLKLYDK